jgi:hypothetical protein
MCKAVNIAHPKGFFIHGRERGYKVKCNYLPYLIYTSTKGLQLTQEDLLNEEKKGKDNSKGLSLV